MVELGKFERKKFKNSILQDGHAKMEEEPTHLYPFPKKEALTLNRGTKLGRDSYPIMLWWSPLTGETGRLRQCGPVACFFTMNRTYLHEPMTRALLFYGKKACCLSPCVCRHPIPKRRYCSPPKGEVVELTFKCFGMPDFPCYCSVEGLSFWQIE